MCLIAQSCPTLCDPMDCDLPGSSVHGDSPGKNTGVGCHALLQGIFPTQGSNLRSCAFCIGRGHLIHEALGEPCCRTERLGSLFLMKEARCPGPHAPRPHCSMRSRNRQIQRHRKPVSGCWWWEGVLPECLCIWGHECFLELNTNDDCPTPGKYEMPQNRSPERVNCTLCEFCLNF